MIGVMDKETAIKMAGGRNKLAALLGISGPAITHWVVMPEPRIKQLRKLKPHWFRKRRNVPPPLDVSPGA